MQRINPNTELEITVKLFQKDRPIHVDMDLQEAKDERENS